MSTSSTDQTWNVRYDFKSKNPGPGDWTNNQTFGPTSEAAARSMFESARMDDHMRNVVLLHGEVEVDRI